MEDFKPSGDPRGPLVKATSWIQYSENFTRETNTMPQWAGSCWYYLRYLDPKNADAIVDPEIEKAWGPVDLYVGGAEHAVLHLLYARFWHKVLYDFGYVSTKEPFQRLVNQGMILGEMEYTAFQNADGAWVSARDVDVDKATNVATLKADGSELKAVKLAQKDVAKSGDNYVLASDSSIVAIGKSEKMSKSRGNVVNPDDVVAQYGADSLRLYEMFMGPLEAVKPWNMDGVSGVRNFLDRVWRMIVSQDPEKTELHEAVQDVEPTEEQNRVLHKTIKATTEDIKALSFNTAIARMMECANFFSRQDVRPKSAMKTFVLLVSPFAPHLAEELWQLLGASTTLAYEPWPTWCENALRESAVVVPVQINGKVRARIEVAADADADAMEAAALADEKIAAAVEGKTIVKKIIVPGKMVNLVVK